MASTTREGDRPRRGPGRPRSVRRGERVLAAALDEIAEHGISGLAIERVAARAGVSKVTVYRRWPDRIALVLAALETLPELVVPDTGTIRDDLRALRVELVHVVAESSLADVLPALLAERRRSEHREAIARYVEQRSAGFGTVVARAIARGELRTTRPPALVAELLAAPLAMSIMNRDHPYTDDEWCAVVDTVLAGLHHEGAHP